MIATPQRPALAVNIGITGHRTGKLKIETAPRVSAVLTKVFTSIDLACMEVRAANSDLFSDAPCQISLVSGLAQGADQIAVDARPSHWRVMAVLPFPRERYKQDFADGNVETGSSTERSFNEALDAADIVVELPLEKSPIAYARAGGFMLRQIDILVAVWDGRDSAGPGGTADVVARALKGNIPVVWVSSDHDQAPWLLKDISEAKRHAPLADATAGPIKEAIENIFGLPAEGTVRSSAIQADNAGARLRDYIAERIRNRCYGIGYECLRKGLRIWTWRPFVLTIDLPSVEPEWTKFTDDFSDDPNFARKLHQILKPRFISADSLATYFSHLYRSAYVFVYFLAFLAVAAAVVGGLPLFAHSLDHRAALKLKGLVVLLELAPISVAIFIVWFGRKNRWHDRWLETERLQRC
jgi:hypothetical protein